MVLGGEPPGRVGRCRKTSQSPLFEGFCFTSTFRTWIEAFIVNALTNRRPLYKLEEFFRGMDVEKLFGPGT